MQPFRTEFPTNLDAEYDLIVIGSGPAGEGATMKAAKDGMRVLMIERYREVGGGCTHWATIPSKALRHQVNQLLELRRHPVYGAIIAQHPPSYPQILRATQGVITKQATMRRDFYVRNHVQVVMGHGRFLEPHEIAIDTPTGTKRVRSKKFVIAVGSRPYRPTDLDFHHARIRDSDTILKLDGTPESITIYGGGVVGCEYASIFRNLGLKVNLVHNRDKLLSFLDDEIVDALAYHLRDQGVVIRHNEEYDRVEATDDAVTLLTKSGKRIKSEILLWAQGRTGNSHDLGLEHVGIQTDARGQIKVDGHFRTSVPHIYAVGDVIGYPSLASASYDQGRFAAHHAVHGESETHLVEQIPTGIYTSPEISSLGKTERELTAAGVPYEVGHSLFRSLARAQITNHTVGMLKLLFHRDTLEILGIHCFGDQAAEIVHIGQAIMSQPKGANTLRYFANTTFNYPTMAEAYRVAALNGLNRLA